MTKPPCYPIVILVEPQLSENVGMAARAMMNFNLEDMRIVQPRDPMVKVNALRSSAGADMILAKAKLYQNIKSATNDLNFIYATTARRRYLNKKALTLDKAFADQNLPNHLQASIPNLLNNKVGILFGGERSGLSNEALSFSNIMINIETNPSFKSLNLAQAVALTCYEWGKSNIDLFKEKTNNTILAQQKELNHFLAFLLEQLTIKNFFKDQSSKSSMTIKIRNLFLDKHLTSSELSILYGIIRSISFN